MIRRALSKRCLESLLNPNCWCKKIWQPQKQIFSAETIFWIFKTLKISYSFRIKFSLMLLKTWTVSSLGCGTIQGWKLFKGGNYLRKYGRYLFAVQFLRVPALSWKHFRWCTFFHASTGKGTNYSIDRRSVYHYLQLHLKEHVSFTKGQLISKCIFGVFNSSKKWTKTNRLEVP